MWSNFQVMKKNAEMFSRYSKHHALVEKSQTDRQPVSGRLPGVHAMGAINRHSKESIEIIQDSKGKLSVKAGGSPEELGPEYSFFHIIERQGFKVTKYFNEENQKTLSPISIYDLGLKLLDFFESLHRSGYVLNDLTLDKVRMDFKKKLHGCKLKQLFESGFDGKTLHITDFTYSTPFIDFKSGKWLKQSRVDCIFNLNNENQSFNRFMKLRTGPRDDLESMCNLMIYISNGYEVLDLVYPKQAKYNLENKMSYLQEYRKSY